MFNDPKPIAVIKRKFLLNGTFRLMILYFTLPSLSVPFRLYYFCVYFLIFGFNYPRVMLYLAKQLLLRQWQTNGFNKINN